MNMRTDNNRRRAGFTMIELSIVMLMLSIVLVIIYNMYLGTIRSSNYTIQKVKMRDEARNAMEYMLSNLRMAHMYPQLDEIDDPVESLRYEDADGNLQPWPPLDNDGAVDATVMTTRVVFVRPIDNDLDGIPYAAGTAEVEWSDEITFMLDVNDVNGDGQTNQVVQLNDGVFVRTLVNDVSPVVVGGANSDYDTPAVGGFAFFADDRFPADDASIVNCVLIQLRQVDGVNGTEVRTRLDGTVDVLN